MKGLGVCKIFGRTQRLSHRMTSYYFTNSNPCTSKIRATFSIYLIFITMAKNQDDSVQRFSTHEKTA